MEVFSYLRNFPSSVITIGNFDGLHLGHVKILKMSRDKALARRVPLVVITFWPHPVEVVKGEAWLLQTLPQRLRSLGQFASATLVLPFNEFRNMSALDFLSVMRKELNPMAVLVGEEFRFGRDRSGDASLLRKVSGEWGIEALAIRKLEDAQGKISSSRIRKHLMKGEVERANILLSEPYTVEGIRVRGEGRGKKLGFPTLNFKPENPIVPRGIFAGLLRFRGKTYPAAIYVGSKPTFRGKERGIEAHLLEDSADVPEGARAGIVFLKKIRDEKSFHDAVELKEAISKDVKIVRDYFRRKN